jgi:hypothetical protein
MIGRERGAASATMFGRQACLVRRIGVVARVGLHLALRTGLRGMSDMVGKSRRQHEHGAQYHEPAAQVR